MKWESTENSFSFSVCLDLIWRFLMLNFSLLIQIFISKKTIFVFTFCWSFDLVCFIIRVSWLKWNIIFELMKYHYWINEILSKCPIIFLCVYLYIVYTIEVNKTFSFLKLFDFSFQLSYCIICERFFLTKTLFFENIKNIVHSKIL